jgi:hypothetical protein
VSLRSSLARQSVALLAALSTFGSVLPAQAQSAPTACTFQKGFAVLKSLIPNTVGTCLSDEGRNEISGNTEQRTSGGMLVYSPSRNLVAFTDGRTTWLVGPDGLASRPNQGPAFAWESKSCAEPIAARPLRTMAPIEVLETLGLEIGPRLLPLPLRASQKQASFILTAAEWARAAQRETGVPASVTVAQAILESDWGTSKLTARDNNYFGIKAFGRAGSAGVAWYPTWEVINGEDVTVCAPFRAYSNGYDSFVDHGRFFLENRRYATALKQTKDPVAFAQGIADAGYATDPDYATKLITLMDRFNLYGYDLGYDQQEFQARVQALTR